MLDLFIRVLYFVILVTPTPHVLSDVTPTPTPTQAPFRVLSTATPVQSRLSDFRAVSGDKVNADNEENAAAYRIGVSDVLKIEILGMDDMSKTVVVSEDGTIPYHFIGAVSCDALTPGELEKKISDLISPGYLRNPQVSVTITEFNSKKVFILGEVKMPGAYVLKKVTSLIEIISQAGGLTASAGKTAMILRKKTSSDMNITYQSIPAGADEEVIQVNLQSLFGGDFSNNLEVRKNDTIYIPQSDFFFIIGAVQKPGTYPLEPRTTVLQAITLAGGFTEKASKKKVKIVRITGDEQQTLRVTVDEPVLSQDTIIVEESFF